MGDLLACTVRYVCEAKMTPPSAEMRGFKSRIDKVSTRLTEYQGDVSNKFNQILADKPSKARLKAKLTRDSLRWSCVHDTQEILMLTISALAVAKANVSESTIQDYRQIVNCLDETASKQYARLMFSEEQSLWEESCTRLKQQFSSLQAWADSRPRQYRGIKYSIGGVGTFAAGGGIASIVMYCLPASICAGGPVFIIGGLIALVIGGCGLGLAYYMQRQKQKKEAFNGALLKMIQDLNRDMTGVPDLSEVLRLLKATREQAATKWGVLLSPEQQQALRPHIDECSVCLLLMHTDQDLVVPITDAAECMNAHVFHARCLREQGDCPLCRRNYLGQKHLVRRASRRRLGELPLLKSVLPLLKK